MAVASLPLPTVAAGRRPAKLLHVFPTFALGGAQRRTIDLANAFGSAQAHTIVALDGNTSANVQFSKDVAVSLREVPVKACSGLSLGNLWRLRELLRSEAPDLLLTYNFGALEAALANRLWPLCPHIHFEDGFGPDESDGRQLPRRVWLRRVALSGRSTLVVPSRTLERIALQCWRLRPGRVRYIPNGIDVTRYGPEVPLPAPAWRRPGELVIGSVGGLRPEKNYARLLRVFASLDEGLPPLRLVLVGDGVERTSLARLADQLGVADRVTFAGFLADPRPALRGFDVFALTSDTEQMPFGLVEAMAMGLPIVATEVGDVASMLPDGGDEWVVPAAKEDAFASRLRALIEDPVLRRELAVRHRRHARSAFNVDAMLASYSRLFKTTAAYRLQLS